MKIRIIYLLLFVLILSSCGQKQKNIVNGYKQEKNIVSEYKKKYIGAYNKQIDFLDKNNLIYNKIGQIDLTGNVQINKDDVKGNIFCNNKNKCIVVFVKDEKKHKVDSVLEDKQQLDRKYTEILSKINETYDKNLNNIKNQYKTLDNFHKKMFVEYQKMLEKEFSNSVYLLDGNKRFILNGCIKAKLYISTKPKHVVNNFVKPHSYLKFNTDKEIIDIYGCDNKDNEWSMYDFEDEDNYVFKKDKNIYLLSVSSFFGKDFIMKELGLKKGIINNSAKNKGIKLKITEKLITKKANGAHPEISTNGQNICYSKSKIIGKKKPKSIFQDKPTYIYKTNIYINNKRVLNLNPGQLVSCKNYNDKFVILVYDSKNDKNLVILGDKKMNFEKGMNLMFAAKFMPKQIVNKDGNILVSYSKNGNYLKFSNGESYYLKGDKIKSISMYYNKDTREGKVLYSTDEGLKGYNSLYLLSFIFN